MIPRSLFCLHAPDLTSKKLVQEEPFTDCMLCSFKQPLHTTKQQQHPQKAHGLGGEDEKGCVERTRERHVQKKKKEKKKMTKKHGDGKQREIFLLEVVWVESARGDLKLS